jgi:hypothetical protein
MRLFQVISASLFFALAACGPAAAPSEAGAQTDDEVASDERSAILSAVSATADAQGAVENECGERVAPQFIATDLGPGAGRMVAYVIGGGSNTAACYGDGPLVQLMHAEGGAWREVYQNRGGAIIVLSTQHNGANDLAGGGPGFSFPVWEWNGDEYVNANRTVADSALGDARFVPN